MFGKMRAMITMATAQIGRLEERNGETSAEKRGELKHT
jgi:hypothetical protein